MIATPKVNPAKVNPATDEVIVRMTGNSFLMTSLQGPSTEMSEGEKRDLIKLLIGHLGAVHEKPRYFDSVVYPFFRGAVAGAERSFLSWTIESKPWRAVKRYFGSGSWGPYGF